MVVGCIFVVYLSIYLFIINLDTPPARPREAVDPEDQHLREGFRRGAGQRKLTLVSKLSVGWNDGMMD